MRTFSSCLWLNHSDDTADWASAVTKADKKILLTQQTWLSVVCLADLSVFVSPFFCLSSALLAFHSLPYLLFLMADWRQGWRREWARETAEKRRIRGMRIQEREGRALGKALMKNLWSLLWLSSARVLFKKGPTSLWRRGVISSPFLLSISPSDSLFSLFLSFPCEIFASSFSYNRLLSLPLCSPPPFTNPTSPLVLCDQDMDHVSS